eukprot:TRINITY_DN3121_c4_g4_i1.p1 TRINITY_DN3121_c4_g4~~TRINITY_DN3121_c4_g4_i1.p1  ORF type:complete len:195 (+),score=45.18 TRINITY_DN3121_c4_g4_i1:671-1255(+)
MESLFGFVGKDFVVIVATTGRARSIIEMKSDDDKIYIIDENKLMGIVDDGSGDGRMFAEYIQKNCHYYSMVNGVCYDTHATSNFIRSTLAEHLRTSPYNVFTLVGGIDDKKPKLYFVDYLGALMELNNGCHGYASNFLGSTFDANWKPDMTRDEAMELINKLIEQYQRRCVVKSPGFMVKFISEEGITCETIKK